MKLDPDTMLVVATFVAVHYKYPRGGLSYQRISFWYEKNTQVYSKGNLSYDLLDNVYIYIYIYVCVVTTQEQTCGPSKPDYE